MQRIWIAALVGAAALAPRPARAQGQNVPGVDRATYDSVQLIGNNHYRFAGNVELDQGDTKIYADAVELWTDEHRAVASGNVVLEQGDNRIAADRAEFDTQTRLGTFYSASGIATIRPPRQTTRPGGAVLPPVSGQDTDIYFFGDTVEKQGPKKYRITNGGFTTCVQPTPRWDLHAGSVVLNLDHYTMLRQAVLKVKGVPLFYSPILYYPTKRDGRATGFLLPTYGSTGLRGQSIANQFFWAIDRSQDATFKHEWYSKTGQGFGGEYRYNLGTGDGSVNVFALREHASTSVQNGQEYTLPASNSFEVRGTASQALPGRLRARTRVDYFSDLTTAQTFNTNIYDATRNQRTIAANLTGAWGAYSLNGTFDRSEYFYSQDSSALTGSMPRVSFTRTERPLAPGLPIYTSFTSEYAGLVRNSRGGGVETDTSVTRLDVAPQIRYPFTHWQWFTVNAAVAWRDTFYTRSADPTRLDPLTGRPTIIDDNLNRRFFTLQAQMVGPVFNRIWDTPGNGYAEKFKHSIEPFFNVSRTSSIPHRDEIVQLEGVDAIVGGTTQLSYGIRNRFYAKVRRGETTQTREFVTVELSQTYYTNDLASQFDSNYNSSFGIGTPSKFSPLLLNVRAAPTDAINGTVRVEFDSRTRALRSVAANGAYTWARRLQGTVGWAKTNQIQPGSPSTSTVSHFLNASSNVHTADNRYGAVYALNWDILRSTVQQQRLSGFYNAQCCGIAFEYQTYSFGPLSIVPADHRFFLSFSLAGLGSFSPLNGALGDVPR
jgi:LPS-assembly protein